MKEKNCKKFFGFLLSALLVLTISLPAFADMGPKPSVTLKLYYTPQQRYAVTLLGSTKVSGPWGAVLVFITEACAYCRWLPWPEGKTPHPVLYALTANLLSFGVGWVLNAHCSNTQVRLIGLGCLLLWYAIPQLGRKPVHFEQNVQETDKKL